MDTNDDLGKPPFLKLEHMSDGEMEYIMMWLDFYLAKQDPAPEIVGYLTEYIETIDFYPQLKVICDAAAAKVAAAKL